MAKNVFVTNAPTMSCCGNTRENCDCSPAEKQRIANAEARITRQERERAEATEGDESPLMIPTMAEILNCEQDEMRHENAKRLSGKSGKKTEEEEMADFINEVTADDDEDVTANEDAPLTVPTMNWKEISASHRSKDAQRGSSGDIHQTDDDGEALPTPLTYDWDAISRENARRR